MNLKPLQAGILVVLLLSAASDARGQGALISVSWDPSFPTGDTGEFIGEHSLRSYGCDVKGFITPRVAMGASFDWRLFDEVRSEVAEVDDGHVSGPQARRLYASPVLLTATYYSGSFSDHPRFVYYIAGGGGAYRIEERIEIGVYTTKYRAWNFGLCAEIGTLARVYGGYALLRFKYHYAFESEDVSPLSWWSVGIGFVNIY